jgi:NAD-dependent dihydropyrimidine dehydrogenase PreA subunit
MKRDIIKIDEGRCTGCGLCIPNCPEGALQIIDGKARLVSDLSCDGLGACIGHCPEDAITIEKREAVPYDEHKVMENIVKAGPNVIRAHLDHLRGHGQDDYLAQALAFLRTRGIPVPAPTPAAPAHACPGSKIMDFRDADAVKDKGRSDSMAASATAGSNADLPSELRQWPVQLQLLSPNAPYFRDADLLVAADCVPFTYAGFHERFLKGKILIIFCPKLDGATDLYIDKLTEIFKNNTIKSVTVLHMEVPCCFGTTQVVEEALKRSGKKIAMKDYTISIKGKICTEN